MKKLLLLLLLIPQIALAQSSPFIRNDDAATIIQGTNQQPIKSGTNKYGAAYLGAAVTGGYTPYQHAAVVGTVLAVKSSSAATLGGWYLYNAANTPCYVQIFDVATAGAVALGTTVPKLSLGIPAGAAANIPAVAPGILFANGIQIASTTTQAGSTPCGTGTDVNFWYK